MTRKGDLSSHQIYGDIDSRVTADFVTSLLAVSETHNQTDKPTQLSAPSGEKVEAKRREEKVDLYAPIHQ